jgi:glutaredoxin/cytochrome c biogenesis protein CcdA
MKKIFPAQWLLFLCLIGVSFGPLATTTSAQETIPSQDAVVYMFGRDDCGFCKKQKEWMDAEQIPYVYLNITTDKEASRLFGAIAEKHHTSKVTPLTIIGEEVILGFNGGNTTGESIKKAIQSAESTDIRTPQEHLDRAPSQDVTVGGSCSEAECDITAPQEYLFELPLLGVVNLKSFSLVSLSLILGLIDGFNPCAMWVLITFLVLLSQAGSRKKMLFLAGVFIVAEAIMYNLILNVWYATWDFVALDNIVTPLVGLLAFGGGSFFLYRWYKNRGAALVCDISSIDQQSKTISKLQSIISRPLAVTTVGAIILIAFSVNIIEFACSIGIPQAYTKILEMNVLTFFEQQWYLLLYTLGYMADDFVVFGLAIWGYSKLEAHGHKYSQLALLIGGVLMLLMGVLLIINPSLLVL